MAENVNVVSHSVDFIELAIKKYLEYKSVPSVDLFPDEHDEGQDVTISTIAWNLSKSELGEFYNFLTHDLKLKINTSFQSRIFCWIQDDEIEAASSEEKLYIGQTELGDILANIAGVTNLDITRNSETLTFEVYVTKDDPKEVKLREWAEINNFDYNTLEVDGKVKFSIIFPLVRQGNKEMFSYCTPQFLRQRALRILRERNIKCQDAGGYSPSNLYVLRIAPSKNTADVPEIAKSLEENGYKSIVKEETRVKLITTIPFATAEPKTQSEKRKASKNNEITEITSTVNSDLETKMLMSVFENLDQINKAAVVSASKIFAKFLAEQEKRNPFTPEHMFQRFIKRGLILVQPTDGIVTIKMPNNWAVKDGKIQVPADNIIELVKTLSSFKAVITEKL